MKFKSIPFWKVKRELRRVWRQITVDLPRWFYGEWQYIHYRFSEKNIRVTEGGKKIEKNAAVFLIFARDGLQRSHEVVLEYLSANGVATVVVSNLPLSEADRQKLVPLSVSILERDNFGYDFGGYRDGILHIADILPDLDELLILNDSMWFPLGPNRNWIERARNSGAQFVGPIDATGSVERTELYDFETVHWDWRRSRRNYHMSSFILWFGKDIVRAPDFLRFWKNLRVSNDKTQTVRRGEMGISRFIRSRGYTLAPIVDLVDFPDVVYGLEVAELREVFEGFLIDLPQWQMKLFHEQLERYDASEDWRQTTAKMILALATKGHMAYMAPLMILRYMDGMFLKKALVPKNAATAEVVVKLLRDYPEYFPADIAAEIEQTITRTHTN